MNKYEAKTSFPADATIRDKVLTLHELAAMKDVPASEPMPAFEQPVEYTFDIDGDASADVQAVVGSAGKSPHTKLTIKARGSIRESGPVAIGEVISAEELARISADKASPQSHRPKWLDIVYLPKLLPIPELEPFTGFPNLLSPRVAEQTARDWPWTTVGKLQVTRPGVPGMTVGSGVMVGPNLMVTASHAVPWGTNNSTIQFTPAFRNGSDPRFGHAFVERWRGVRAAQNDPNGLDYVICKLNWRIGDRTGWMGSIHSTNDDFYEDRRWISVGYPTSFSGGQRPAVEVNVRVEDIDNEGSDGREIETNRFASGGWSGGPLWGFVNGDPRVVGVCSGQEKDGFDPRRDVHAGGRHLVDLVKFGFANWV